MQDIQDCLNGKIPELVTFQKEVSEKSDFQLEAKALWLKADDAGYSVAEFKQACDGEILSSTCWNSRRVLQGALAPMSRQAIEAFTVLAFVVAPT